MCLEKCEEVPLGGEGGQEEAVEGDAAGVGGGQQDQAENQLHCSHLPAHLSVFLFLFLVPDFYALYQRSWYHGTIRFPRPSRLSCFYILLSVALR